MRSPVTLTLRISLSLRRLYHGWPIFDRCCCKQPTCSTEKSAMSRPQNAGRTGKRRSAFVAEFAAFDFRAAILTLHEFPPLCFISNIYCEYILCYINLNSRGQADKGVFNARIEVFVMKIGQQALKSGQKPVII